VNVIGITANLFSYVIFTLICLFIFLCLIVFSGLAVSEGFVEAGLSRMSAYFITTGIYLLLLLLALGLRKKITGFFAGSIIKVITQDEEKEGEKEDE
jgi:hypothetical protein